MFLLHVPVACCYKLYTAVKPAAGLQVPQSHLQYCLEQVVVFPPQPLQLFPQCVCTSRHSTAVSFPIPADPLLRLHGLLDVMQFNLYVFGRIHIGGLIVQL
jgi:hypothetical protein